MDRKGIVDGITNRCKSLILGLLDDSDLETASAASLALLEKFRDVGREILQLWVDERFRRLLAGGVPDCCDAGSVVFVHTRRVTVTTLFGEVAFPVRTFRCTACGTYLRPDDIPLGVPDRGWFGDDVRSLYEPLVAELPHRVASDVFSRFTGVELSSRGAQGVIDSTAADLREWREKREGQEAKEVSGLRAEGKDLVLEISMDGVMAHIDGSWREPKVGTVVVRHGGEKTEEGAPKLGEVVARRFACVLGSADDLAREIKRTIREAGWGEIPLAEILGDGAPWIWNLADEHFPGVRQTLDWFHLRQHLFAFANEAYTDSCRAKAWVDMKMEALLEDRVGDVLGGLKRMRCGAKAAREALHDLLRYVEVNRRRIRYGEPWNAGLAVGSGSAEGACKNLIQTRFKRAGMRWKSLGFLNVLELRLARLNGTDQQFWRARGLHGKAVA